MVNRSMIRTARCLIAAAVLCAVPSGFAAVSMQLTGIGNNGILGGVYVGPYVATIEGVGSNIQVICDDFVHDTYFNESWNADVYSFSDLLNPLTGSSVLSKLTYNSQGLAAYQRAAWLTLQLLNPYATCVNSLGNCAGDIQYAIWENFASASVLGGQTPPFGYLPAADLENAKAWLDKAKAVDYAKVDFSSVYIYTPDGSAPTCPGYTNNKCPTSPSQEFIRVRTPEASEVAILGLDLSFLGLLAFRFRRLVIG